MAAETPAQKLQRIEQAVDFWYDRPGSFAQGQYAHYCRLARTLREQIERDENGGLTQAEVDYFDQWDPFPEEAE